MEVVTNEKKDMAFFANYHPVAMNGHDLKGVIRSRKNDLIDELIRCACDVI